MSRLHKPQGFRAYYNEHDPFAAAWLRNLIHAGLIAPGDVDERSIEDVTPTDLAGYTQCHFFAGIGGWSYALRLAGWPDDRPVWTGSCPCQPFSAAGKGKGHADERHLWPAWFHLIEQCQPGVIFGEQVEAAIKHGWLDLVQTDLEGIGYAVGAVGLPAAGVGAPHIRQRLWFVAEFYEQQRDGRGNIRARGRGESANSSALADAEHAERRPQRLDRKNERYRHDSGRTEAHGIVGACGEICELADSTSVRLKQQRGAEGVEVQRQCAERTREHPQPEHAGHGDDGDQPGRINTQPSGPTAAPGATRGFWHPADWLPCRDGKARPVEPGTFPLAHGVPARVGRLRGYGNAIVPQVAAEVIRAYLSLELIR